VSSKDLPDLASVHTIVFDFDGVFTDNKVWVDQNGHESVCCDRGDGLAFDMLRAFKRRGELSAEMFVLSKESNSVVQQRARKLKLDCESCVGDKLAFMQNYLEERFPSADNPFSGVVYLGNDLNDLPAMRRVGFAVAPEDAHPRVRGVSQLVISRRGGDGFIRAFVERFLRIDKFTEDQIDELISNC
jgi:3-deoxy-D-manno-octulosonate 8-phosphate phosphatase (KDO 8-P phosphatase)